MNTTRLLAALALLISATFSTASFAQSGTITFTGRIVAPACTGSITHSDNPTHPLAALSLGQCANSQAQLVRTSIASPQASTTAPEYANSSAIVTVTYE